MSGEKLNRELWCDYDFDVNKYHWIHKGVETALPIRQSNLIEIGGVLNEIGIPFWLQGRTLLGAVEQGSLLDDHDDDIGVDSVHQHKLTKDVYEKLKNKGFDLIRDNDDIVSYIKNGRYIDICLFRSKGKRYGYANKSFPKKYFVGLEVMPFMGVNFPIPNDAKGLLKVMYTASRKQKTFEFLEKLLHLSKYKNFARRIAEKGLNTLPHKMRLFFSFFCSFTGVSYKKIEKNEFLDLLIESNDSFNWKWRKPHLDVLTDNKLNTKIGEILSYIKDADGLDSLIGSVKETDTSFKFEEFHNYDPRFWQSGNNYFIYNVKYQFRKGVLEYQHANEYIESNKKPLLYTAKYYDSLSEMSKSEIERLIKRSPIELTGGAVTSGKHRVCAMMGRILAGKEYLPFWAIVRGDA